MHHTRGIHAYNYGLPRWDAIFGTRRNPERWEAEYGFWDGASSELGPMLLGRDIGDAPADAARSCAEGARWTRDRSELEPDDGLAADGRFSASSGA